MQDAHTPPVEAGQSARLAKAYAEAHFRKQELTAELGEVSKTLANLEEALVQAMIADELGDLSVETPRGRLRVFPRLETFVSVPPENKAAFVEVLEQQGFGELLDTSVHPSRLRAWVKEQQQEGELPSSIAHLLRITQVQRICTRAL